METILNVFLFFKDFLLLKVIFGHFWPFSSTLSKVRYDWVSLTGSKAWQSCIIHFEVQSGPWVGLPANFSWICYTLVRRLGDLLHWGGYRKPWILFQSPEKNYFSHLLKKCYLLKEKILGLCLGCPQHHKENKGILFLSLQNNGNRPYAAYIQDKAPGPFPLRNSLFWLNLKSSFIPEAELE